MNGAPRVGIDGRRGTHGCHALPTSLPRCARRRPPLDHDVALGRAVDHGVVLPLGLGVGAAFNPLEIQGCIVTIDATGCQREIATQIGPQGADYVVAVKDNPPQLHAAIRDYFDTARAAHFAALAASSWKETDAGHGRCEVRRRWLVEDLGTLPEPHPWCGLRSIALVQAERHRAQQVTHESGFYTKQFRVFRFLCFVSRWRCE